MTVFFTSARSRGVLTAIRSMGRRGIEVVAGDAYKHSISFYSKYCSQSFLYPVPQKEEMFINSLYQMVKNTKSEVLFPGHDDTVHLISKHKETFEAITAVSVPDIGVLIKAFDKYLSMKSAEKIGIPIPETYSVENENELKKLSKEVEYPFVVKPNLQNLGYGAHGVTYAHTIDELIHTYERTKKEFGSCIIQEFIPGGSEQMRMVNALFDKNSNPIAVFTARKYRTHPVRGGSTTFGESTWDPKLAELGMKLLKAWRWYGVAEIEFKLDPRDGELKLIEVNPRFWTYIDLPIACGIDFPYLLYKIAIGENVAPIKKYRIGVKFVNLLADPLVMLKILTNSKSKMDTLKDLFRSYNGKKTYSLASFDDPIPLIYEITWNLRNFQSDIFKSRM
jgi:D-aspartate ligase